MKESVYITRNKKKTVDYKRIKNMKVYCTKKENKKRGKEKLSSKIHIQEFFE